MVKMNRQMNIFENDENAIKEYTSVVQLPQEIRDEVNKFIYKNLPFRDGKLIFLDIGVGKGDFSLPFLEYLEQKGNIEWEFYAFDISEKMINHLRENINNSKLLKAKQHRIHLWIDDANNPIKLAENSIDVIILTFVLHYISNWRELIFNIKKLLKSGGILIQATSKGYFNCLGGIFKELLDTPGIHVDLWKKFFEIKKQVANISWNPKVDFTNLHEVNEFLNNIGFELKDSRNFLWYKDIDIATAIKWMKLSPLSSIGAGLSLAQREQIVNFVKEWFFHNYDSNLLYKKYKVPFGYNILIHKKG